LTELEAHAVRRGFELRVRSVCGKQREHPLLLVAQSLTRARAELVEDRRVGIDRVLDVPPALAGAQLVGNLDRLVDDVEPQVVVNETRVRVDLGVNTRPELDGGLELRRTREKALLC
jgi:hypothetical protein